MHEYETLSDGSIGEYCWPSTPPKKEDKKVTVNSDGINDNDTKKILDETDNFIKAEIDDMRTRMKQLTQEVADYHMTTVKLEMAIEHWKEIASEALMANASLKFQVNEANSYIDEMHVEHWKSVEEHTPEVNNRVVGYHPEWIDETNLQGTRECVVVECSANGTFWKSTVWNNDMSWYGLEDGAPEHWLYVPASVLDD